MRKEIPRDYLRRLGLAATDENQKWRFELKNKEISPNALLAKSGIKLTLRSSPRPGWAQVLTISIYD